MTKTSGSNVFLSSGQSAVSGGFKGQSMTSFEASLGALMSRSHNSHQDEALLAETLANAGVALREAARAAADAAARARALAVGLDVILAELPTAAAAPVASARIVPAASHETISLSRREQEVLALVTQGHTNKAIADTLFVSPNTVKTHVTSLLHKLHAETRTQLAAIATRQFPLLSAQEPGLI